MAWWTFALAAYGAGLSTYTALRTLWEPNPYLTFFQPVDVRSADSVTVRIHNPSRKMIFIVAPGRVRVWKSDGTENLLKLTPRGPETGVSTDFLALMFTGRWQLGIAPGESADFNIGPVYPKMDVVFLIDWHRGRPRRLRLPRRLQDRLNPLQVPVTPEVEDLIGTGRIDSQLRRLRPLE